LATTAFNLSGTHFLDLSEEDQNVIRELANGQVAAVEAIPPTSLPKNEAHEIEKLRLELEDLKERENERLHTDEVRIKEQRELWSVQYPSLAFDSQPIRWTLQKGHRDRLQIESVLRRLCNEERLDHRGRMSNTHEHHVGFKLCGGIDARLYYNLSVGKVLVTLMCKKNEAKKFDRE